MSTQHRTALLAILFLVIELLARTPALAQSVKPLSTNPLHWAAAKNDVPAMKALLAQYPAEIDSTDGDTRSALHYAAANGAADAVDLLISRGANLNIGTHKKGTAEAANVTPLAWAIEYNHHDIALKLIKAHCDVNLVRTDCNQSPLWVSCNRGDTKLIFALLDAGADPKFQNPDKWTCLNWLCANADDPIVVKAFLMHGVDPTLRNYHGNTALCSAMANGAPASAKVLLDNGAEIDDRGEIEPITEKKTALTATGYAAQRHVDCLRFALAYGGDPTTKDALGRECLQIAIDGHKIDCEQLLREYLALKDQGWTPAHYAAHVGIIDAFPYLLAHKASLNARSSDGQTPLMIACAANNSEAVAKLLALHCQVNLRDGKGDTALHKVVRQGNELLARILIAAECDTTIRNSQGETAGDIARAKGSPDLVRALESASVSGASPTLLRKFLSNRDSISVRDLLKQNRSLAKHRYAKEWTPLHFAAFEGDDESAAALLVSGAEVDARNDNGSTPLMIAVQEDKSAVVKLLLAHKASVATKDKQGWSPLHIAAQENRMEVAKSLLLAGAAKQAKDNKGRTPRDIAILTGRADLARILK